MKHGIKFALAGTAALLLAGQTFANPSNIGPPGGALLDLGGQAIPHSYTQYTASFVATAASTAVTFLFRDDPAFEFFDDASVTDTTNPGPNLLANGGFETGDLTGWNYLNQYGATFPGVVATNGPHSGTFNWYDGSVQAYDALSQSIATTAGDTYSISFWLSENSGDSTFSDLSTNGDVSDNNGNGIDLLVYAGDAPPPPTTPEPASLALLGGGLAALGALRRCKKA